MKLKMAERTKLEGLLKAMQDIKTDYYVGTQEAYRAVKKISSEIYENPERTAIMINHALKQKFVNPSYEATPERVYGTFDVLNDAILYADEPHYDEPDETTLLLTNDYYEMMENIRDLNTFDKDNPFKMQPSDLSRIFTPYFVSANEKRMDNNEEFGEGVIDCLGENFYEYSDNVNPRFARDYISWVSRFLTYLGSVNWEGELSKESFNRRLNRHRGIILNEDLDLERIVDRLVNDRYDHRLEYRRQVLCYWLEDWDDYEEVVKTTEYMIKSRVARYKKLESLNAPLFIIEKERKMIQSAKFVRHLLGSERNFVKRYLEH